MIIGDAVHNLRSALDHLACHVVSVGTNGAGPFKGIYFPIVETAAKYKTDAPGKVKGMRDAAKDAIDKIEPYEGGASEALWQLHRLNNIDKHRLVLTVYKSFRS